MNKKIKIIELLNLLAENSIKKGTRINYNNVIYKVDFPNLAGVYKENGGTSLYDNLFTSLDIIELNEYVEILEDEEEIDIQAIQKVSEGAIYKTENIIDTLIGAVRYLDKKINKE